MTTVFEKYEIPMEVTVTSLESAVWVYNVLVESLTAESTPTAEYESSVRETWGKEETSETFTSTVEAIHALVWNLLSVEPHSSVRLFEEIGSLRSDVKDERDYQVRMFSRLNRPKAAVSSEFEDGKADAEALKVFIDGCYTNLKMFGTEIPSTIKTKTMTDNTVKVVLPRLPNGPREGGGRKSATHNLRLVVDGTKYDLPVERVLHDVVSSGVNRVTLSDLIKEVGTHFSTNGWESPTILNGHSIVGVCENTDNEDDENEDEPEYGPPAPTE